MLRKLLLLDAAVALEELRVPPGNRLEKRKGDRAGPHSIRVNIYEIVHGKRAITADTALRLRRYFWMSAQFWLNLQTRYDLEIERDLLGPRLGAEVTVYAAAS